MTEGGALSHYTLALAVSTLVVLAGAPARAADGQAIFQAKCAGCHTIGGGKTVGPDLKDVLKRRPKDWVTSFVAAPEKLIASGDATAKQLVAENGNMPMPNVGLSADEVAAVVGHLGGDGKPAAQAVPGADAKPAAAPEAGPKGDPVIGQALFTGETPLKAGGPACISCHHAGTPGLGGGTLARDLTGVSERLGPGLLPALKTLPFPLMKDVYAGKPLSDGEAADLAAYFQQASKAPESTGGMSFMAIGAGGALALFAGMGAFWPRRRRSVHERLKGDRR